MRTNHPVSQREHEFPPGQTLVSVTDLKGRITYCNGSFVEVSGFPAEDLLGQPHNVVRHPDMPAEAFRDLWTTIQAGQPWTGVVKNRRRNGDHYWVQANATPMFDGDRITGYLSVRTQPTRQAVDAAQALYRTMSTQTGDSWRRVGLRQGSVVRLDAMGRLQQMLTPGLRGQLVALHAAALALTAACATQGPALAAAGGLLALAAASWGVWRMAVSPLQIVARDANRLASGDLTHQVGTGAPGIAGQLQRALMQLSVNLRTVVLDTRKGIGGVQTAAAEIAAGNSDLSARTESQASSLEETAASLEEITTTAKHSANAAAKGARLAQEAAAVAGRSHEAVEGVAQTMESISDSSRRISEIIHVIDGVAFQTNILALNAAVEAARAGESGRGFSVVASEVRALAQRTSIAAREIKQLIAESAERVALGNTRSAEARERMQGAVQAVNQVSAVLAQISSAANEQQGAVSQINAAVSQMDTITQQNAAMVEELAAAAQSLQGQVEAVDASVRLFRLEAGDAGMAQPDAVELRRRARGAAAAGAHDAAFSVA